MGSSVSQIDSNTPRFDSIPLDTIRTSCKYRSMVSTMLESNCKWNSFASNEMKAIDSQVDSNNGIRDISQVDSQVDSEAKFSASQ